MEAHALLLGCTLPEEGTSFPNPTEAWSSLAGALVEMCLDDQLWLRLLSIPIAPTGHTALSQSVRRRNRQRLLDFLLRRPRVSRVSPATSASRQGPPFKVLIIVEGKIPSLSK